MGHAHFGVTSHLGKLAITLLLRGVPASMEMALQAQLGKNLRSASTVTQTSPMSRDRCIWKNNGLCSIGSHARITGPPYVTAP